MKQFLRLLAFTPSLAGILQGYIVFILSEEHFDVSSVRWFLYFSLPYAICWVIAARVNALAGFVGALFALIDDMITLYGVFVEPSHSTAPINLVFAPMANLILLVPVGLAIGWCMDYGIRAYGRRGATPSKKS
ncbi:hypothetical protein M1D80_18485 [Phyllobacteriaceae bacterium JZ32]